jgi:hypothetical protein
VALKAFRLFVRESFCARCLAIAPDRGIFDRRAANRTQRQKSVSSIACRGSHESKNERRDHQEVASPIWNMARLH